MNINDIAILQIQKKSLAETGCDSVSAILVPRYVPNPLNLTFKTVKVKVRLGPVEPFSTLTLNRYGNGWKNGLLDVTSRPVLVVLDREYAVYFESTQTP